MLKKSLEGRVIFKGDVEGEILKSEEPFMFAHGVNPETGEIIDKRSDIYKKNMKNKIFIFPYGKGSTTGSMWLLEVIRRGNGPKAIINKETEMIIATGVVLGQLFYNEKIPILDRIDFNVFKKLKSFNYAILKNNQLILVVK